MSATNEHDFRSPEQLKSLFLDQQWLITCLAQANGSYQGYLADLTKAWKAADAQTCQQLHDRQPPTAVADCIRYALIHTTIAGNLGPRLPSANPYNINGDELLTIESLGDVLSAEVPVDPLQSSLETIVKIEDPEKRAEALVQLAERVSDDQRDKVVWAAIETILTIQQGYSPADLWQNLHPYLLGRHYTEYLRFIFASSNEVARAWFIISAAKTIGKNLLGGAVNSAFSIRDPWLRALALRSLVRRTRGKRRAQSIQELYRTAPMIVDPMWKGRIFVELVGKLSGKQQAHVIKQATIWLVPEHTYGWDAYKLMPYLTGAQRSRLIAKIINAKGLFKRIEACITLWHYLPMQTRQQVLNMMLQVRDRPKRALFLARIAQKWRSKAAHQDVIQHLVTAVQEIRNEDYRRAAISKIRPYVEDDVLERIANLPISRLTPNIESLPGYRFAFAQRDRQYVAYALGNLSTYMDDGLKSSTQSLMVDIALEIDLHDYVAEAIEEIAPYLDEDHLAKALEGALQIGDGWSRVWALSGLAPYLRGNPLKICLGDALDAIGSLEDDDHSSSSWFFVDMAARLLPSLNGRVRERVLNKGLSVAKMSDQTSYDSRIRFLPYLDGEAQSELAKSILEDISRLPDEHAQSRTLSNLSAYLPNHLIQTAILSARRIIDDDEREAALSAIIPYHPDTQLALVLAQNLVEPFRKSGALVRLLPGLVGELHTETLRMAMEVTATILAPGYRMARWIDFFPLVENQAIVQQKVIEALLDYLWSEKDSHRNSVLALCANSQYVSATILPENVLKAIGEHIMQICLEWGW